jgi:hypothetical protein
MKQINQSQAGNLLGVTAGVVARLAKLVGVKPTRPGGLGVGSQHPAMYTMEDLELIKMAMAEHYKPRPGAKGPRKFKAKAKPKIDKPAKVAHGITDTYWGEFNAVCRKLAQLCKALHVSLVAVETDPDGKQKVDYEMTHTGQVKL